MLCLLEGSTAELLQRNAVQAHDTALAFGMVKCIRFRKPGESQVPFETTEPHNPQLRRPWRVLETMAQGDKCGETLVTPSGDDVRFPHEAYRMAF